MVHNVIEAFYKEVPAVICTAGSYIATANNSARLKLSHLSEGEHLYDCMMPRDVLRFEAHFCSREKFSSFSFPVLGFRGYRYATAVFDMIFGRRYAVVFLLKEENEDTALKEYIKEGGDWSEGSTSSLAKELLGISDIHFESEGERGLIDLRTAAGAAVSTLSRSRSFYDFDIRLTESDEMKEALCMPEDISMTAFLQMIVQMIFAAAQISCDRYCEVKLCKYGCNAEIRVTTDAGQIENEVFSIDALIECVPSVRPYITACEYVAGICHSTLSLVTVGETKTLTLVLSIKEKLFEDVDFKSRDLLYGFSSAFEFVYRYTSLLLSGNAEKKS